MLLGLQYTLATPGDWTWFDVKPGVAARAWERSAKKSKVTPGTVVSPNNVPGWVMAANVQGVIFEGMDAYACALDATGTGLVVTGWTEDYGSDNYAVEFTFLPPAPDPAFGGQVNTRQQRRSWNEPGNPDTLPWSQFVRPPEAITRYGCYVTEPLLEAHKSARSERGWRDWIGG